MRSLLAMCVTVLLIAFPFTALKAAMTVFSAKGYDAPIGCTPNSVFNLVEGITLSTFVSASAASNAHSLAIVPNYNNGQGAAYQVMLNGAGNLVVATSGLRPASYFGSLQYSTGNNPDVTNTIGVIGNPYTDKLFIHGTKVVAPCNATNCLHNWLFATTGAGPGIDTDFAIGSANAGQGTLGGVLTTTPVSSLIFLHRLVTPPATTMLWQFDTAATTTMQFSNVGNVSTREMVQDTSYVYFTSGVDNTVKRVAKDGMALTSFSISPTAIQDTIALSTTYSRFYIATILAGTLTIRAYDSSFSSTANLVIGAETPVPFGLMMDETAQKLYLVTEVAGIKRVRRINPSTLSVEQTLSINLGTSGFVAASDFTNRSLWISDIGNPSHLTRVQLCT